QPATSNQQPATSNQQPATDPLQVWIAADDGSLRIIQAPLARATLTVRRDGPMLSPSLRRAA
ncbi:MAG: hypothetical protein ABI779_01655, partial [Acidobacteriota bacterium]